MIIVNQRDRIEWRAGMTVRDVMHAMEWDYVLIVVSVNGEHVEPDDYDTSPVPDDADVRIIHIAHGG
ncbi:MAG: sulfur carrier protein ThiS [Pseudomonadota bacterium]